MKNKTIEPLISLVIIGAVFCASLFAILQTEKALNRQLRATVFQPQEGQKQEAGEQLITKAAEHMKQIFSSSCLKNAYNNFENLWNQECEKRGLEEKCDLPKDIATDLLDEYQELEQGCY